MLGKMARCHRPVAQKTLLIGRKMGSRRGMSGVVALGVIAAGPARLWMVMARVTIGFWRSLLGE
jgi:hypothetical protein